MPQKSHSNAKTNVHIRTLIQSNEDHSNSELASRFSVSTNTISKWRNRSSLEDASSRPHRITYSLDELNEAIVVSLRRSTWMPIDEVLDIASANIPTLSRTAVYRCFVRNGVNIQPKEEREKAGKFKEYKPGYLHVDVTYLPKFEGKSFYLFVAIDRATRLLFFMIYEQKTAENASDFFDKCVDFFPFSITHILTDNGLEFTNKLLMSKKGSPCTKDSKFDGKCIEHKVEHRLTKPFTPKTNGMVERVNGTIKNGTILNTNYEDFNEMHLDLLKFLVFYNVNRRHGSLKREFSVRTPCDALEKWYRLEPKIFNKKPDSVQNKLLNLHSIYCQPLSTTS